ncbi:MAG: DUF2309 family protein, partial [Planctomycetales bacterium]|nr:DUF2309 family protein [Planctomycetales bacterium]
MSTTSIAAENADPIVGDGGVALAQLSQAIEAAAHLLPSQGPIEVFVHHNTLHVFEEEPFHDAVVSGLHCYGANPYLPEQHYRQLLASGRIQEADLQSVLREHLADANAEHINGLGTREEIRLAMLRHPLLIGPDAELRWIVAETDALDRFRPEVSEKARQRILKGSRQLLRSQTHSFPELKELLDLIGADCNTWSGSSWESFSLHALWRICRSGIESLQGPARPEQRVRPRDILLHALGEDIESQVQDLLIRFCGAFLDQGYSDWELPDREQGFYESFIALFSQPKHVPYRWLRGLPNLLLDLKDRQVSALESVAESLSALAISADSQQELIRQNLLSLRGWAGMIWQVEAGVDWLVHKIPRGSLVGFLAVQLLLERLAIEQVGEDVFGKRQSAYEVIAEARKKLRPSEPMSHDRQAFLLFQIAQMLGWQPQQLLDLSRAEWHELAHEVSGFNSLKRRRIYHEAYERHYRHSALDAFAAHAKRRRSLSNVSSPQRPAFQIVTCIDDREESFRRHLEEVRPDCETFGAAGFFVVAMHYRGAADGFFKPLCPGVIIPDHYVQEDVGYTFQGVHRSRTKLRKRLGLAGHLFQRRSRTFLGGIVAGIV